MNAEQYTKKFGVEPKYDDLERVNCVQAGTSCHYMCGICTYCEKPRHMCGHASYYEPEKVK